MVKLVGNLQKFSTSENVADTKFSKKKEPEIAIKIEFCLQLYIKVKTLSNYRSIKKT